MRFVLALLVAIAVTSLPALATPPSSVTREGGVTVVTQSDPSAALVGVELAVAAGLNRQQLSQSGLAALTAESILHTPVSGVPLDQAIAARGGSVSYTIEPTGVRFYVEALATDAPAVFDAFATALAAPDFSGATVAAARDALMRRIGNEQRQPLAVGVEMLDLAQSAGNNTGMPMLGTPASLVQLSPSAASAFYRAFYRRGGASISAVGRVDALGAQTIARLAADLPQGTTPVVKTRVNGLISSHRELVARRDVNAPWLVVQYSAPSITSSDYGPMLVLAAFLRRTLGDIAEIPGTISPTAASGAVGALYDYDSTQASLVLYIDGSIGEPGRTFGTALSVVNVLSATRLEGSIEQFKRIAAGDFAIGASTLQSRARLAGIFARRTGSADYLDATLRAISATTPADLQRVARRYLARPTIALVLPRSG